MALNIADKISAARLGFYFVLFWFSLTCRWFAFLVLMHVNSFFLSFNFNKFSGCVLKLVFLEHNIESTCLYFLSLPEDFLQYIFEYIFLVLFYLFCLQVKTDSSCVRNLPLNQLFFSYLLTFFCIFFTKCTIFWSVSFISLTLFQPHLFCFFLLPISLNFS